MYAFTHTLLGKSIDSPSVEALKRLHYPFELVPVPSRSVPAAEGGAAAGDDEAAVAGVGSPMVGIKHSADLTFQPEDLVAMSFQHIKKIAEADSDAPVKDCVITVRRACVHLIACLHSANLM